MSGHEYARHRDRGRATAQKRYAEGGKIRSENAEYTKAQKVLQRNPPVTVMEDLIGRYVGSKNSSNAIRDAIRREAGDRMRETGYNYMPYGDDPYASKEK